MTSATPSATLPAQPSPDAAGATSTYEWLVAMLGQEFQVPAEQLALDAPLDALGVDSLGIAELLFNVEDAFGIVLPPEPVNLPTVGDVVAFIDGLIAEQKPAGPPALLSPA